MYFSDTKLHRQIYQSVVNQSNIQNFDTLILYFVVLAELVLLRGNPSQL